MSRGITVWEKCEHGATKLHQLWSGLRFCGLCPGGRSVSLTPTEAEQVLTNAWDEWIGDTGAFQEFGSSFAVKHLLAVVDKETP